MCIERLDGESGKIATSRVNRLGVAAKGEKTVARHTYIHACMGCECLTSNSEIEMDVRVLVVHFTSPMCTHE